MPLFFTFSSRSELQKVQKMLIRPKKLFCSQQFNMGIKKTLNMKLISIPMKKLEKSYRNKVSD